MNVFFSSINLLILLVLVSCNNTSGSKGFGHITFSNKNGYQIKIYTENVNSKPVLSEIQKYDDENKLIERIVFDDNNEIIEIDSFYYDKEKRMIKKQIRYEDNAFVYSLFYYNNLGLLEKESSYDNNNNLNYQVFYYYKPNGLKYKETYLDKRNTIEKTEHFFYYDKQGYIIEEKTISGNTGFRTVFLYDSVNIENKDYGVNLEKLNTIDRLHIITKANNKVKEIKEYIITKDKNKILEKVKSYDGLGKLKNIKYYIDSDTPVAIERYEYE